MYLYIYIYEIRHCYFYKDKEGPIQIYAFVAKMHLALRYNQDANKISRRSTGERSIINI